MSHQSSPLIALDLKDVSNDLELFVHLREALRGNFWDRFLRSISLKTYRGVRFIEYKLGKAGTIVDRLCDRFPPNERTEYDSAPRPLEIIPPIPSKLFLHYLNTPSSSCNSTAGVLSRIPKLRFGTLNEATEAWGIEILEDISFLRFFLRLVILAFFLSLLVAPAFVVLLAFHLLHSGTPSKLDGKFVLSNPLTWSTEWLVGISLACIFFQLPIICFIVSDELAKRHKPAPRKSQQSQMSVEWPKERTRQAARNKQPQILQRLLERAVPYLRRAFAMWQNFLDLPKLDPLFSNDRSGNGTSVVRKFSCSCGRTLYISQDQVNKSDLEQNLSNRYTTFSKSDTRETSGGNDEDIEMQRQELGGYGSSDPQGSSTSRGEMGTSQNGRGDGVGEGEDSGGGDDPVDDPYPDDSSDSQ